MFKYVTKYCVQMTNILLRLFDLEIKNKQIIKKKDKFIQNLQRAFGEGVETQSRIVGYEQ